MNWRAVRNSPIVSYLLAVLSSVAAVVLTNATWDVVQGSMFIFLFGAVAFSAWQGGLTVGVLCIFLSISLMHGFVVIPMSTLDADVSQFVRYGLFALTAGVICWLEEQRHRAQRSLEGLRLELEVILNSVSDGIIAQDTVGKLIFANHSARQILGEQALRVSTRSLLDRLRDRYQLLTTHVNDDTDATLHDRVVASSKPSESLIGLVDDQGETRWLHVRGVPVLDGAKSVRLVVKILQDVTDEHRLQEQQAASNKQLREVLNNLAAFVCVVTLDGTLTEVNEAALKAANLRREDVLHRHFADTYWWAYDPSVQQQLREAIAKAARGERVRYDVKVRLTTNAAITIDFMLAPVFDEVGQAKYLVASGIDITSRIKLMQQLDGQQRRYHTILNSLPGIVYEGTGSEDASEQKMLFVSRYAEVLLGYPMERWILSDNFWREIVHPDDWHTATQKATHVYRTGANEPVCFRCYAADGRLVFMESYNAAIHGEDGEIIGTCGVVMDVTQRHQQEQEIKRLNAALAVERQRLEQIIANVPGVVYEGVVLPEGRGQRLTYVSAHVESLLGYTPAELIAHPELWQQIIVQEDWPTLLARTNELYQQTTSGSVLFRARTRDQRMLYLEMRASAVCHPDGSLIGSVGVITDVTQRQQQEEAIRRYAVELRRSNAELEQFAYVASHDLQEPLRMVTSYLQLVEQRYVDRLDADGREFIGYAVDGASRMKELINDLLAYSRIQRSADDFAPVSMQEVFARAVHNLQIMIEDKGAEVTSDPLPEVMANRVQMVQLLQNLIGNALKFSADRPPRVHVGVQQEGSMWRFSVQDNGIGIESAYLDRIFVIFQRLHSRERYEGTGIGLAICRRIVEKHGGEISVESTPGVGSTFYFTIPIRQPKGTNNDGTRSNSAG